jgi:hypothetical protein
VLGENGKGVESGIVFLIGKRERGVIKTNGQKKGGRREGGILGSSFYRAPM